VKFTPAGGRVTLSSDVAAPGEVCLRIKDSGPGIPADMQSRIFEPFRQLREGSSEGVGLGLAISRTLARASGGDVSVESEPGDGATFIVRLPRAR
jgi:protein-histidine pros-kinase